MDERIKEECIHFNPVTMKNKPVIAVTMGDPGGVGPEIILKALRDFPLSDDFLILLIGSQAVFEFAAKKLNIPFSSNPIQTLEPSILRADSVNFLDVSDEADLLFCKIKGRRRKAEEVFDAGKASLLNSTLAYGSIKVAAYQAACGLVQAVVTAPVSKEAIRAVDRKFIGHTEFLAQTSKTKKYAMLFHSGYFCVTLATIHISLKKVSSAIKTKEIYSKIKLTHDFLVKSLKNRLPKIAVACLNPHGSEFGEEEEKIIRPAVQLAAKHGFNVKGPLPGDQVFHEAYEKKVDAVVAMYHDQGLAPFKMIAFDSGVNVTLGLPYVRTSPDHGTAFDIAYQNKANPKSFLEALKLAKRLILS